MKFRPVKITGCAVLILLLTAFGAQSRLPGAKLQKDLIAKKNMRILRAYDYRTHFWNNLKQADTRVWISTYSITGPRSRMMSSFFERMTEKADSGVDVRLLLPGKLDDAREVARKLRQQYGFPVRLHQGEGLLHAKFILIDNKQIYNGSANMTLTAFNRPYETSIYLESEKLFPKFKEYFLEVWEQAK